MNEHRTYRVPREAWYVAFVFFIFVLLHNADKFLISPLLSTIEDEFELNYKQIGAIQTGASLVAVVFMPVWGYLFDKYTRPKLVALASAIWGSTTILSTFSRNYVELIAARSLTGIDNEATSGVVSFLGDYFPPEKRSTAIGILNTSAPLGALIGTIVGTVMSDSMGWRSAFMLTAIPGLLLAILVLLTVKDRPRGASEPELLKVKDRLADVFKKDSLAKFFRRRSTAFLFAQGFFGVFPWQIVTYWFFLYMERNRGFAQDEQLIVMIVAILAMVLGNLVAGVMTDWMFRRTLRGRPLFAGISVAIGLIFFDLTLITRGGVWLFIILGALTGFFIPMAGPGVSASLQDISLPEVRSTVLSIQLFFENVGSAFAPFLTGLLADIMGLETAMVAIITVTWSLCAVLLTSASFTISKDIEWKHRELTERAKRLSQEQIP